MTTALRLCRLARVPLVALVYPWLAVGAGAGVGCTYDFTVGRAPSRDGGSAGGDGGDTTSDAAGGPQSDAGSDDSSTTTAPCADLAAKVSQGRLPAIACDTSMGDFCDEFVIDECGCAVGVVDTTDPATRSWNDAITQFKAAGCTPVCPTSSCPRSVAPGDYWCQHGSGTTVGKCTPSF